MNKGELIAKVAESGMTKKDAENAINAVFGAIGDALAAGDSVQLIGFGTFGVKEKASKKPIFPAAIWRFIWDRFSQSILSCTFAVPADVRTRKPRSALF